jgi:hypothetical protein
MERDENSSRIFSDPHGHVSESYTERQITLSEAGEPAEGFFGFGVGGGGHVLEVDADPLSRSREVVDLAEILA